MSKFNTSNDAGLKDLEKFLDQHAFLGGEQPAKEDAEIFNSLKAVPNKSKYPNLYFYYATLCNFTPAAMTAFKGTCVEVKKAAPAEDDIDLFGSDDDEVVEKPVVKKVEPVVVKKEKKKVIAKSIIAFDVKVYEQEQDLSELFDRIMKIEMDGLVWNKEKKILPVAFGMNKL